MPNFENCKPTYQFVKNKRQRDASMSSEGEGTKEKSKEEIIDGEVDQIMNVLATKGDIC
jgi:hypothetical protein